MSDICFLWASQLWVGRRKTPILDETPILDDVPKKRRKKNLGGKGLIFWPLSRMHRKFKLFRTSAWVLYAIALGTNYRPANLVQHIIWYVTTKAKYPLPQSRRFLEANDWVTAYGSSICGGRGKHSIKIDNAKIFIAKSATLGG